MRVQTRQGYGEALSLLSRGRIDRAKGCYDTSPNIEIVEKEQTGVATVVPKREHRPGWCGGCSRCGPKRKGSRRRVEAIIVENGDSGTEVRIDDALDVGGKASKEVSLGCDRLG